MRKLVALSSILSLGLAAFALAPQQLARAEVYYANCSEVRAAGAAPIHRGEPGYRPALDRDGDGIACE